MAVFRCDNKFWEKWRYSNNRLFQEGKWLYKGQIFLTCTNSEFSGLGKNKTIVNRAPLVNLLLQDLLGQSHGVSEIICPTHSPWTWDEVTFNRCLTWSSDHSYCNTLKYSLGCNPIPPESWILFKPLLESRIRLKMLRVRVCFAVFLEFCALTGSDLGSYTQTHPTWPLSDQSSTTPSIHLPWPTRYTLLSHMTAIMWMGCDFN